MAKIRVNDVRGLFGMDIARALQKAQPGDTLVLSEGHHMIGNKWLQDLHITGQGDPSKVVLQGQLELRGYCSLHNLTVEAPHFRNAVTVKAPASSATLDNVFMVAEPGQKYPALYAANTTIQIRRVRFVQEPSMNAIVFEDAVVGAANSYLGTVHAENSTLELTDCDAETLMLHNQSQVTANGKLQCTPPDGRRSIALSEESVGVFERLVDTSSTAEALCDDSFIEIFDLETPNAATYLVISHAHATVRAPVVAVTIHDPEVAAQQPKPYAEHGPNAIVWKPEDAHAYAEVIAPPLEEDIDTLLLEEGEYFLDLEPNNYMPYNLKLVGLGQAENTILHGSIGPMENGHISVENLTIKSAGGETAFSVYDDATASLTNVIFDTDEHANDALVYLETGETFMTNCTVKASVEKQGAGELAVVSTAKLNVQDSSLGWFTAAEHSQVVLDNCSVLDLNGRGAAQIKAQGILELLPSHADAPVLVADTGASIRLDHVVVRNDRGAFVNAEASLSINSVETADGQPLVISHVDESQVLVDSPNVVFENVSLPESQATGNPTGPRISSPPETAAAQVEYSQPEVQESTSAQADPLAEIMNLTGLEKVKEQIRAFVKMVSFNQKRAELGLRTTEQTLHSVFLGNPGTGKTTVARLLSDALYHAGAIRTSNFYEVSRKDLVGTTLGESANMTSAVLKKALGGVLFIDEAYSLYQENNNEFAKEAVEELLTFMENHRDDIAIIFAGYTSEMMDFLTMNPGLKSRIPHQFDFEDYMPEEIASIGYQSLLDHDYIVDEPLYRRVISQRYRQSGADSNGRWVRNFNQRLTSIMAERVTEELDNNSDADIDVQTITEQDLSVLVGGDREAKEQKVDELLAQLDKMTGLDSVKTWVHDLITEVQANQQLQKINAHFAKPTYHMVFEGNPGTGKTTVANIIAQLFYNLGLLESATVRTVDRADLVGKYIGHTEAKTKKIIDEALGGVLFVDEAYQLQGSDNDFGRQAIESFMTRLEDDRDKFVAIFAGYTDEMQKFLGSNPGLRSRIPLAIEFPDYSPEEIGQMVVIRLQSAWTFNAQLLASIAAAAYKVVPVEDRANGRWARTFGDRVVSAQKRWIVEHKITTEEALVIDDAVMFEVAQEAGVGSLDISVSEGTPLEQ